MISYDALDLFLCSFLSSQVGVSDRNSVTPWDLVEVRASDAESERDGGLRLRATLEFRVRLSIRGFVGLGPSGQTDDLA